LAIAALSVPLFVATAVMGMRKNKSPVRVPVESRRRLPPDAD
jgi:hypothetical protein